MSVPTLLYSAFRIISILRSSIIHYLKFFTSGLHTWKIYLEKVGKGELNNELEQVELQHVNITSQLDSLIRFVYPDLRQTDPNSVILATLNSTIDEINDKIIDEAPGVSTLYRLVNDIYISDSQIYFQCTKIYLEHIQISISL